MQAYGKVDEDGSRYLLGDHMGNLHLLVLQHDGEHVVGLKTEPLGRISAPSTISYLDNGVVYIGSSVGDSQLVCPAGLQCFVNFPVGVGCSQRNEDLEDS